MEPQFEPQDQPQVIRFERIHKEKVLYSNLSKKEMRAGKSGIRNTLSACLKSLKEANSLVKQTKAI